MSRPQVIRKEFVDTLFRAASIAQENRHEYVTLEHLTAALMEQEEVQTCLKTLNVEIEPITEALDEFFKAGILGETAAAPAPTKAFDEVVTRCVGTAMFSSRPEPSPTDLLVHLLQHPSDDSHAVTLLLRSGLTSLSVKRFISHGAGATSGGEARPQTGGDFHGPNEMAPAAPITTREEAEKLLDKYCLNLNKAAGESRIDPLIGRHEEVMLIVQIASRRTKNNAILVGEPGVGKTAIAEGLALKIVRGEVPEAIADATVYSLDVGALVAGTRFRGDFEERMKQVLKALEFVPASILFIDEIHTIMGAGSGSQGSLDVANLIKPALAKGTLRCIGSTTMEEFRKHFEKDRALLRRFKRVDVAEPSSDDAKLILRGLRESYETFHGLTFTDEALDAAVDLTTRYLTGVHLPDKAIDIIDNAGARQRILPEDQRKKVLDVADIEFEVSKVTRIPAKEVHEDEAEKLSRLEGDLLAAVYGQEKAVSSVIDAIFVSRAGLREPNKPAGSYLFTGPTGVGKTEVARQLAKTLGVELIKYDMSEYMEKHAVSKLIGAPPGYVGFGDGGSGGGLLVNDVDSNPHCVLLLDEIEKAHPDLFNILLQVMDDGKLTNSSGKSVSFRNVILIMTSNAGAKEMTKRAVGFGSPVRTDADTEVINNTFSPEFRNRLDAVVRFDRLGPASVSKVVDKFLDQLRGMVADRNVALDVTPEARDWLATKGYDPDMGARPLARVIHNNVKIPLSRLLLVGSLKNGGTATLKVENDKLVVA